MKRLFITLTATLVCVGAYGQGKLGFQVNSDNLIYFTTDLNKLNPADRTATANGTGTAFPIAGSGLYTGAGGTIAALSGNLSFVAALYGGTSSSSLSLQTTTTIGDVGSEGSLVGVNCTFASLPAGTPAWFQIEIYDSRAPNPWVARAMFWYEGSSAIFQATPQASVYSPIYDQTPTTVASTWAAGTFPVVDMVQYGPGYYGGIAVGVFYSPEPGTFALVALGAAVLTIYCRRR
jgi:hypothetical protein